MRINRELRIVSRQPLSGATLILILESEVSQGTAELDSYATQIHKMIWLE